MKYLLSGLVVILSFSSYIQIKAQVPGGRGSSQPSEGSVLFGDFTIAGVDPAKSADTYYLILSHESGTVVGRQSISIGGRYRFNNVPNGRYFITVEKGNLEVARIEFEMMEISKTEVRRNIELMARQLAAAESKKGVVSVADSYKRSSENQKLYNQALDASSKNDLKRAVSLLNQVVAADPKDFVAWTELGTVHFKDKNTKESEKAYRTAMDEKPGYFMSTFNLGKLLVSIKKYEDAIEPLTAAVTANKESADANHFLGECYLQIKKGSKAVVYLNEAIRIDPVGKAEIHLRLALLYHGAGLKDKAAEEYAMFLEKKPDHPDKKKMEKYIADNKK